MSILRATAAALAVGVSLFFAQAAWADIPDPPAPCDGKAAGDACQTADTKKDGTCKDQSGKLDCVETTTSSSTSSGSTPAAEESDDGCATASGDKTPSLGFLLLLGGTIAAVRGRRR